MRPRMADVAKLAGVSLATVSRVLNKSKFVDPELEERVEAAIAELDYEPDQHARWLSSRRSNVVGLVIPSVEDSNISAFLHGCSVTLKERGYNLMVALSDGNKHAELDLLSALLQSHVSGLIFVTPQADNKSRALVTKGGVPLLYALNPDRTGRGPSVTFDEARAAEALLKRALRATFASTAKGGTPRVAILAGPEAESSVERRVAGLTSGYRATAGGASEPELVRCDGSIEEGYVAARRLLSRSVPSLLAATSDYLAIAATRAAFELSLSVPRDLSILGFGENVYSHTCSPSITTVRLDGRLLGERCGDTIVALMEDEKVEKVQVLGYELVPGESCPMDLANEEE